MTEANSNCYICYNSHYALAVKRVAKGFSIARLADDASLATIIIRDMSQVAAYQWDHYTGKFFVLIFKDGTARIYNCFNGGKLVSLLRITSKKVVAGVWDRILREPSKDKLHASDHDVTKLMPSMIKFGRDSRNTYILPYEPPYSSWRQNPTQEEGRERDETHILDVHITYLEEDHQFVMMFDGDYILDIPKELADEQFKPSAIKLLTIEHGLYYMFSEDGSFKSLDAQPLLECNLTSAMISNLVLMRQLSRYLQDHVGIIRNDLVLPYTEFLTKICEDEYDIERLNSELTSLLLIGDVPVKLENWCCNAVGEKNLKKWKKLGSEAYQKTIQVLTLAFIPACERLIILAERLRGLLKSVQLKEEQMIVELNDLSKLITTLQSFLQLTLESIKNISHQEILFNNFLEWFSDKVMETIDEDYRPKIKLDYKPNIGHDLLLFFDSTLKKKDQTEAMNSFANVSTFVEMLQKIDLNLELASKNYVKSRVVQKTKTDMHPSVFREPTGATENRIQLLDVTSSSSFLLILYVISLAKPERSLDQYHIGVFEKNAPYNLLSKLRLLDDAIQTPHGRLDHAQVWEIFDVSKHTGKKNVTKAFSVQFVFSEGIPKQSVVDTGKHPLLASTGNRRLVNYVFQLKSNGELKIAQL